MLANKGIPDQVENVGEGVEDRESVDLGVEHKQENEGEEGKQPPTPGEHCPHLDPGFESELHSHELLLLLNQRYASSFREQHFND